MIQAALKTGKLVVYHDSPARDWTYAPDVGRAICRMLASPVLPHHLYQAASGQTLTSVEIAETIQSLLPHVQVDIRGGDDPDAVPLSRRGTLSAERLRQDVGFDEWTSFEDGIKQVMDRERIRDSAC
jgi:nucleoside-diphosphate-sugar epimerase